MNKKNTQKGQVIIINTLLFFTLSTAIIFAVTRPVLSSFNITKSFSKSQQSFMLANSAVNEALYKLNTNKTILAGETVTLSSGEATIAISDYLDTKNIIVESNVDSYKKKYELELESGSGVSFNYGLQVGQGGFEISGGSGVNGNVYSNGSIVGTNGAYITGTAISANISNPTAIISNQGNINPVSYASFGGNSIATPQDVAQSFTLNSSESISALRLFIKKDNSPWSNITVRLVLDNDGKPSKNVLAQGTINSSTVTSIFNYITVPFSNTVTLDADTTYWLVFDTVNFNGPTYLLATNDSEYSDGAISVSQNGWSQSNGGTWTVYATSTQDVYFDLYTAGETGLIDGISIGSNGVGDAWAYEINNSTVAGSVYCQVGSSNNKSCDTTRVNPVMQSYPVSDGNILDWKNEAESGGATSTVSFGSGEYIIGPIKINGNMSVGAGAIVNLEGTTYVTGDIIINGGGIIRVAPTVGQKSVILLSDGTIKTNGGGAFEGSGQSGSYILVATTSDCPDGAGCANNNAIEISGGAGAVVLNAQNGTIEFSGGAEAKQVTAHKIVMTGGTTITYESGLANPSFVSGPSGAWRVRVWQEVE